MVAPGHRRPAVEAVRLYLRENPPPKAPAAPSPEIKARSYSALYVTPILACIHQAIKPGYEHRVFVKTFGADASGILEGDLYRCVTALLLHQDWSHVVNNMAGLLLFGTVTVSACGWGVAWMLVLFSGAAGNLITALWYRQDHISIGASTAVFGALGLCVAFNLWRYARSVRPTWRMWLPLAAGLALLGFLGGSPHTDLMAHLAGFFCGLALGAAYGAFFTRPPGFAAQCAAAAAAIVVVIVSWLWGGYWS